MQICMSHACAQLLNDAREVDMDHIRVELVLMSTDTRISILSNDMDL